MATSKEYFEFIKEQLIDLPDLAFRPMMGEYLLYVQGKVVGGIYDDRLLVKPTDGVKELLPEHRIVIPYPGAKEMLLIEEVEDRDFLRAILLAVAADLPEPKKRK